MVVADRDEDCGDRGLVRGARGRLGGIAGLAAETHVALRCVVPRPSPVCYYVPELLAWFPNARMLVTVRHGREWLDSSHRNANRQVFKKPLFQWANGSRGAFA